MGNYLMTCQAMTW